MVSKGFFEEGLSGAGDLLQAPVILSDVLEYTFCPRFIYFMYCLGLPQQEGMRYKVQRGRDVHEQRSKTNRSYVRKRIGACRKEENVTLRSPSTGVKGILDEVVFFEDGSAAPLEFKFAVYKERIFKTYRTQLVLQGMLIREHYQVPVERGFLCFTRSQSKLVELPFTNEDFKEAMKVVEAIRKIVGEGLYPKKTKNSLKCADCCYRNICV